MTTRSLRLLPLLFVCALAPAVLAQNVDLKVSLSMPPTAVFYAYNASTIGYAVTEGTLTLSNDGMPVSSVTLNLDGLFLTGDEVFNQRITCSGGTCTVPYLQTGSLTLAVAMQWFNVAPGTVERMSARVSPTRFPDPDLTNNVASASTTIVFQSNVTLDGMGVTSPIAPGKSSAVAAYYSNHGPSPATDLSITISIPAGARYEGYNAQSWFHCTEPPLGGPGDLVCTAPAIKIISNDAVQALVSVDPSLAPGTVLTLNGSLTGTSALQSPQTASVSLAVIAPSSADAVVNVAATASRPPVLAGEMTTETYTVSNAGPADAKGVTLDVTLPNGIVPAATASTFDACSGTAPMHCTAATLAAGATISLAVPVRTTTSGTFRSTAVVKWLNGGPDSASADLVVTATPPRRRSTRH